MGDIRDIIKSQIQQIEPLDELENAYKSDVLMWIDSGSDLFRIAKPDKPPKHLVSYFLLIDKKRRSLLLVDHIKAQLWLPTGGHVEINEDPRNTVKREIKEELMKEAIFLNGNDMPLFVTVTETVGLTAGHTDVSLWYLLEGNCDEKLDYDRGEFNSIKWFSFDEILGTSISKLDPQMHRFVQKLLMQPALSPTAP
ncbi:MAG: NUDIX domain-containing protein [Candidatus Micrarchaeaceae archaeon]|jgi:ADP-ribose pyrophosphatase YjhB (NUDIX family)